MAGKQTTPFNIVSFRVLVSGIIFGVLIALVSVAAYSAKKSGKIVGKADDDGLFSSIAFSFEPPSTVKVYGYTFKESVFECPDGWSGERREYDEFLGFQDQTNTVEVLSYSSDVTPETKRELGIGKEIEFKREYENETIQYREYSVKRLEVTIFEGPNVYTVTDELNGTQQIAANVSITGPVKIDDGTITCSRKKCPTPPPAQSLGRPKTVYAAELAVAATACPATPTPETP